MNIYFLSSKFWAGLFRINPAQSSFQNESTVPPWGPGGGAMVVDLLYVSVTILVVSLICQVFHCSPKRPPSTRRGRNIPRRITSGPISIDVAFFASKVCGQVQGCCFMITSGNKPLLSTNALLRNYDSLCHSLSIQAQAPPSKHEVW